MVTSRVIALNGPSSVGKSSIGGAIQAASEEPWILIGIDTFLPLLGPDYLWVPMQGIHGRKGRQGISFDRQPDGSVAVTIGPAGRRLMDGLRTAVAALVADGHDLILDLVVLDLHEQGWWRAALTGADVLWVGVECPLAVLEAREQTRGDRVLGLARAQAGAVHQGMAYDLVIDTSTTPVEQAAATIIDRLQA
jgi:chloramphenicol 3-O phosphotransferase